MKLKTHKLLSILLALVLLCSLAGPLALSARAAGPYNVGLDDIFNGSVTVDKTAAEEGEAVSFTATPAEGYALASVSVYAIDLGQSVEVNWNAETGGFVCLMPASQVQISASFKAPATFTVTFDPNGGTGTMAAQSITEEETWTIPDCEFTPPGGKVFDSWLISPVSGSQPHFPRVGNPGSGLSFGLDHGFDMIAQAQWKDAPATTYTITVNGGKAYKAGGVEITGAAAGDFVYILFDDDAAPAGKYIEWGSAVTEPAALLSAGMISGTEYQAGFIMPAANITVSPDYLDQKSLTVDLTGGTSTDTSAASNAVWSLYRAEDLGLDKTLTIPAAEYSPVTFKFPVPAAATCTVTLIAYDKTNATEKAGGEVAFSDSGKGTTISGDYQENSSRTVGVYPASDYTFTGWAKGSPSGEIVSTASPYTFTVTEDVTLYALFEKVTAYPVWVGSTQVTSANKDDILGDGGKAKYDPTSKTLTLDNPSITTTHGGDAICTESGDLTIKGTATLSASVFSRADLTIDADLTCTRLFSYNDTVIKGGEIKVTAGSGSGIECHAGTLKISGGNVTVTSTGSYGVNTGVKITGGTVNITGKTNGIYTSNYAGNECVNITGGTVTITGTDGDGIYSPSGGVTVSGEDTEVTVNGQTYAVKLKNDLTVSDPLAIVEPEGGEVSTITEDSKTYNVVVSGETPAKTVVIKKAGPTVTTYPVWVGGVQVTSANKDDILGDGTASYDFDTNTLTLTNANIEIKNGNGIRYNEKSGMPFNIVLNGENRIADFDELRAQLSVSSTVQAIQDEISRTASMTPIKNDAKRGRSGVNPTAVGVVATIVALLLFSAVGLWWLPQNPLMGVFTNGSTVPATVAAPTEDWTGPVMANYVGQKYEDVVASYKGTIKVSADGDFSDTVPKGSVMTQEPAAGEPITTSDNILYVVISKGPQLTALPDIVGKSYTAAAEELTNAGFIANQTVKFSDTVDEGKVMEYVGLKAGDKIETGSEVTIKVSRGKQKTTNNQ